MDIQRFRKKPVTIEAMQFISGRNQNGPQVANWMHTHSVAASYDQGVVNIPTLEGTMTASPGDWIIRGVQGEFYPCKPDIFEATYKAANGEYEYGVAIRWSDEPLHFVDVVGQPLEWCQDYLERCEKVWGDGSHVIVRRPIIPVPEWEVME